MANLPSDIRWVADYLLQNLNLLEGVALEKRVSVFEGQHAIDLLLLPKYVNDTSSLQEKAKKAVVATLQQQLPFVSSKVVLSPPVIGSPERASLVMATLLEYGLVRRVKILKKKVKQIPPHLQTSNPGPPEHIFVVEPSPSTSWDPNGHYILQYEGSMLLTYLYSVLLFLVILIGVMYPLWPYNLRMGVYYLSMVAIGLLCLLFVTAILRLILFFVIQVSTGTRFWLFPNLFEDCGFFESFVPLYGFEVAGSTATNNKED